MKVLLVEDCEQDRAIVAHLLKKTDVVLSFAPTLAAALEALDSETFDCALVDPGLPDSLPTETVKAILERNPSATVIVISGNTDPATEAAALKAGVHGYLKKDLDTNGTYLLRVIKDAIVRRMVQKQV